MGALALLLPFAQELIKKFLPDPQAQADAQLRLAAMVQNGELAELAARTELARGQLAINANEAGHASLWVAGWRPFIGWTCGGALFSQYILRPWVQWAAVVMGHPIPDLPGIDGELWQLLGGMLGLGALRTVEKIKGVA